MSAANCSRSTSRASGPSRAMPGTSAGDRTTYTASPFRVPCSVRSKPLPSSRWTRSASGPWPGLGGAGADGPASGGVGFDLTEQGTRKGLAVYVVRSPAEVPGIARLGPDALSVDQETFAALLAGRSGQLKGALTDQTLIAGIGNAYSDEILHNARLSPFKMADRLSDDEVLRLYDAMRVTLTEALGRQEGQKAATMKGEKRSGLQVHARTGLPCPVCGDTVREVSFADTSLQYCPTCQTGGKLLADRRMSKLLR